MGVEAKVAILACVQAVPDPAQLQANLRNQGMMARIVTEPCSSKVEAHQLLRLLANGFDLVWVIGCPEDRCRLAEGSTRMGFRVGHAQEYLKEIGLEPERLGYSRLTATATDALMEVAALLKERQARLGAKFRAAGLEKES